MTSRGEVTRTKRRRGEVTRTKRIWPNGTEEVQEQLFGNLEHLHQTTMFITILRQVCPSENTEEEEEDQEEEELSATMVEVLGFDSIGTTNKRAMNKNRK
jgi:hypothetical protein